MNLPAIRPSSEVALAKIYALEHINAQVPQIPCSTHHLFHAGMYARTITIPAGSLLTGALIKLATILIVNGDATVATGDSSMRLAGYHVIPASAHRKQAFIAHSDTQLTMIFATAAKDVHAAEAEFTNEADLLFSRHGENVVNITGE
jgi:hypothetical protein